MELEHEHFDTYVYDFVKVFERHSPLKQENPHIHEYFLSTYTKLESETRHHTSLENTKLHSLARDLFLQVCHLKNT